MQNEAFRIIDLLAEQQPVSERDYDVVIRSFSADVAAYAAERANFIRQKHFGDGIYTRGLIEFSNICRNNCLYCGIRRDNRAIERYRLSDEEILDCCRNGYRLGCRTFVLQSGEDVGCDERLPDLIRRIRRDFSDCAVTLSVGERPRETYEAFFEAGATRYLLRHETADPVHYAMLHPASQRFDNRMRCLHDLKDIGYQVGCGFMVGSPGQTVECLAADFMFIQSFRPQMVGIGPFIPHRQTPFRDEASGSVPLTLYLLSLIRLTLHRVLLPATTALATLDPSGREKGILAGANVVMPNLSPSESRRNYLLYNGKIGVSNVAADGFEQLRTQLEAIGCRLLTDRGDAVGFA